MGRIVPSAVLRRQIEDSWILLLVSPLWLSLLSLNACKRMHSKHTSAEIGWSASQTLRDGADVASLGRNYTETSEHWMHYTDQPATQLMQSSGIPRRGHSQRLWKEARSQCNGPRVFKGSRTFWEVIHGSSPAVSFPSKTELRLFVRVRSQLEGPGLNPNSKENRSQGKLI